MSDRRRQRQQRVRHDAGGVSNPVGASNRNPKPEKENTPPAKGQRQAGSGVAYAEPKEYESVTIMPDKEVAEPQKYRRREVLSNWSRYEERPDEPEEGEDYLIGDDFSQILEQQASSGGGHLRLKGESRWDEAEMGILTSHGLGALRVADLVAAINTVPLYTQLNIPEESLPESVIEFYTQLAEDNRKLYQPSNCNYECPDVDEKIIQSLKITENEPLNLTSEVPETNQSIKNAVDVALSLTSAFAPEPEDVDLDTLIREPSPVRQPSPEKQPSPIREPTPDREPRPVKRPTPVREPSPVKQPTPVREPSPVKQPTPVREPSPVKQPTPVREPSPVKQPTPFREPNPVKQPTPVREPIPVKQPTPVREPSPVKEPSPAKEVLSEPTKATDIQEIKEPDTVPQQKSKGQRERNKRKSQAGSSVKEIKHPNPVAEEKPKAHRGKSKEKSPTSFEFGLPKKVSNDSNPSMEFNFGLPKADVPANHKTNKAKNVKDDIDISNPLKAPENTEEIPEGPTIDLDAPVQQSKPVLLISKAEADDLEDWLDSVLDD